MAEKIVMTQSNEATAALFGTFDINARLIEKAFDVRLSNSGSDSESGDAVVVSGDGANCGIIRRFLALYCCAC